MTLSNWIASRLINITSKHLLRIFVSIIKCGDAMMSLPCISVNRSTMCNHLVRSFVLFILFLWVQYVILGADQGLQSSRETGSHYWNTLNSRHQEGKKREEYKEKTCKNYYYLRTTHVFFLLRVFIFIFLIVSYDRSIRSRWCCSSSSQLSIQQDYYECSFQWIVDIDLCCVCVGKTLCVSSLFHPK